MVEGQRFGAGFGGNSDAVLGWGVCVVVVVDKVYGGVAEDGFMHGSHGDPRRGE